MTLDPVRMRPRTDTPGQAKLWWICFRTLLLFSLILVPLLAALVAGLARWAEKSAAPGERAVFTVAPTHRHAEP